jgi:hypothetical protein
VSTIAERVAAGAKFLDEHDPGWWRADVERAIDLDTLDLHNGDMCVLGQRCPLETTRDCPFYVRAVQLTGIGPDYEDLDFDDQEGIEADIDQWAIPLGFQAGGATGTERAADYRALTAEWKRVITGRRAA